MEDINTRLCQHLQIEQVGISTIKFEAVLIHFSSGVFEALPVVLP